MKSRTSAAFLILAVTVFSFAALSASPARAAGVPTILSYQGRLTDSSGSLLGTAAGTTYYFKFSIWNNATVGSGTRLWPSAAPTSYSTLVRQGVFNVNIGDTAGGYPDALDYDFATEKNVFLQVEVSSNGTSFETLEPRQRIGAAAFAELAGAVSGTTTPSSFGTTTPIGSSMVTIEATSTATVPLSIRAAAGQSADILSIQNSAASKLFYVAASGGLFASSTLQVGGLATLYGGATTTDITVSNGFFQGALADCSSESQTLLYTLSTGKFSCGVDAGGAAGAELNWTYFNGSGIKVSTTTNQVLMGASATTTLAKLEVIGSQYVSGSLGIGTTSPGTPLSVTGAGVFTGIVTAPSFRATSTLAASVFPYASTTAVTVSGTASTTNLTVSSLGTGSTKCVQADASGALSTAAAACGSGGGSSPNVTYTSLGGTTYYTASTTATDNLSWYFNNGFVSNASSTINNLVAVNSTSTNATTTNLSVSGQLDVDTLTSALVLTGTTGIAAEYTGTSCTNQFVRSLSALGVATCATIGTADVSGLDVSDDTNLAVTWPITLTNDTVGWNGLSTSTSAVVGNIPYFSGVNTFANVATSSITISSPITSAGTPGYVIGGSGWTLDVATTTNSLFSGAAGQVLAFTANGWTGVATTTFGTGLTYSSGSVTLNTGNLNTWSVLQTFTGGILVNSASSTIAGSLNITGNSTTTNATTTNLAVSGTASTTNMVISAAGTGSTKCLQVSGAGLVSAAAAACGTGGGYATVADEGTPLAQQTTLNFTGTGVSCADNPGSSRTDCTINAGAATAAGSDGYIQFNTGNALDASSGLVFEKSTGRLGLSTTTPHAALSISTSTRPQLLLSDPSAGAGLKHFYASSTQGSLVIGALDDALSVMTPRLSIGSGGVTTISGGMLASASSTITSLTSVTSTSTAATTTSLAVTSVTSSLLKTNGSGSLIAAVAGTDYLSAALTSIGPANDVATGPAVTLATSSTAYQGLTASTTITRATNTLTFTNTMSGTLAAGGGGTGISNPSAAAVLLGAYAGGSWQQVATSSLGIAIGDTTGTLAVARGGTGVTAFGGANTLLYTTSANTLSSIALGTAGQVLAVSGGAPAWVATTTFSGGLTYAAGNVTLNTANANTWSALQQFNANASTTAFTSTGFAYLATAGGRAGVGTTSPFAKFSVHLTTADTNTMIFAIASSTASATTTLFSVDNTGLTTIGDSSGTGDAAFQFAADTNAWSMGYFATDKTFRIASSTNLSANVYFQIGKSGTTTLNSGITTSNTGQYLCIDATTFEIIRNNTACSASSQRFKENILDLSYGLDDVLKLRPVTFTFRQEMNWGTSTQIGFIAEEVEAVVPELVSYDNYGVVTSVNYPVMVSLLAKAIQDLNLRLEDIASSTASSTPDSISFSARFFDNAFARIRTWLADAANGVGDLFAERLRTNELCVGDGADETCITKAQLDALLLNATVSGGGAPAPAQTEVVTEPAPAATTTEPMSASELAPGTEPAASGTDTTATSTTP